MRDTTTLKASDRPIGDEEGPAPRGLDEQIAHAAHLLPSQGPITVFIHHNTLHAFEDLPFDEALRAASAVYHCQPYLAEEHYRAEVARGRIAREDLEAVLIDDLGEDADFLIGFMGTRYHLRLAMLEHPLRVGTDAEVRWAITGADALGRFRDEAPPDVRQRMIDQTREWALREARDRAAGDHARRDRTPVSRLFDHVATARLGRWDARGWEAFTLRLLWRVCHAGVHGVKRFGEHQPQPTRHRDWLLLATGRDIDRPVHDVLIRFCAPFLDQGLASWSMPGRAHGFFRAFVDLHADTRPIEPWLRDLPGELRRTNQEGLSALDSIEESLRDLGVADAERGAFITATLLALPGWSGMLWQMETNADWTVHPAPPGTLRDYLAVRLLLERLALRHAAREALGTVTTLPELRHELRHRVPHAPRVSVDQRAYLVFQLAQVRGWGPVDLARLSKAEWSRLVEEIEAFDGLARRRVYHLAYEARYRAEALDALHAQSLRLTAAGPGGLETGPPAAPSFQVISCLDEREESLRRHLEEVAPTCETFGTAGFFGVAMYYRGVADAHFQPLCPINIKPCHYVQEDPIRSFEGAHRFQTEARRRLGRFSHLMQVGSRGLVGGLLTGMLGSLSTVPLLMRVLFPRRTARLRRLLGRFAVPPVTHLRLTRAQPRPGRGPGELGYSRPEMAAIVAGILRGTGLTERFAPLVLVLGHGSSSLNNPHEAAYDCGACGGARGGPNSRAFAQMANDYRVRRLLEDVGLFIPDDVVFVGGIHNTCDDSITFFDLHLLPESHREAFDVARDALDEALRRNAHERCRRFESAALQMTAEEALHHVEGRAEDLSQTRPEYGHSTNAMCVVGRRSRTRGLYLDRRAFLTSYDSSQDTPDGAVLAGLLRAVVPVCAGINLEYYFSSVDPIRHGCGTKLPHNIAALLGVMDGAASDLRPGLSWQMVEIHEPMRLLFVVETRPEVLEAILEREEGIARLVRQEWVQLAALDPRGPTIHVYRDGRFEPHAPSRALLPTAPSSRAWYQGSRGHLGFCVITPGAPRASEDDPGSTL